MLLLRLDFCALLSASQRPTILDRSARFWEKRLKHEKVVRVCHILATTLGFALGLGSEQKFR